MSRKTAKTTYHTDAKRRESRLWKSLEPQLQTLKRQYKRDEPSRDPKVIEEATRALLPHLVATTASHFGECRWMVDCDPEEAAQDLLLMLPALFATYGEREKFFPTFLTVVRTFCCSKMRRAHVRRVVELPAEIGHKAESHVNLIIAAEAREIDRRQVHQAWNDLKRNGVLTRNERRALFDTYWREETSAKSSRQRGITPGRINSERHAGRMKLRQALHERGYPKQ